MRLTRDGRFVRTDMWREGKWLDLWSVVHFLSGMSLGFAAPYFNFGTVPTIVIVFLLLVGYEMWEAMVRIHETPQNRFMDVVVGMTSFLPIFLLLRSYTLDYRYILAFVVTFALNITLSTLGWRESQKAAALEKRLRAEYEEQRRKFRERRNRLRLRRQERNSKHSRDSF